MKPAEAAAAPLPSSLTSTKALWNKSHVGNAQLVGNCWPNTVDWPIPTCSFHFPKLFQQHQSFNSNIQLNSFKN